MDKIIASSCLLIAVVATPSFAEESDKFSLPNGIQTVIKNRCLDCHSGESAEADVRLDQLASLNLENRLDLFNRVQEQLFLERMPPDEAEPLSVNQRTVLRKWVSRELNAHHASKLEDKLQQPEYGNYVDHDKLFSGEYADLKPFTYDRRWLISEFIFDAKMNRIIDHKPFLTIDGTREFVIGSNNRRVNLTNPFLLPTNTGVRYYANTTLNGGHLLTMITNAKETADYMIYLTRRNANYAPAIRDIMNEEWEHEKILASRESFLNTHIDRVLLELYQDKHEELLPEFVRVEISSPVSTTGEETKKAPYHSANPGRDEVVTIFRSMRRLERDGDTDEEIIENCEREWFYAGHNERKIQARIVFLQGYMEEFRKQIEQHRFNEKHKPFEYRPPAPEEMEIITKTIRAKREQGDRYNTIIEKCVAAWEEEFQQVRIKAGPPNREQIAALVNELFVKLLERTPSEEELKEYGSLTKSYVDSLGNLKAIHKVIQTLMLRSDFVYRYEFGTVEADEYGRRLMSPRDASYALSYALTDSSPDEQLAEAARSGNLNTREDYRREVVRMLKNREQYYVIDEGVQRLELTASITNIPIRELRFFREFFGYPRLLPVFKDNKRFGGNYDKSKGRLVGETDRLIEHILESDRDVFETLLTTDKFYVFHSGDNDAMKASSDRIRKIYEYFKDTDWKNFETEDLLKHKEFLSEVKMRGVNVEQLSTSGRRNSVREFKTAMESFTLRFDKGQTAAAPFVSFPAHGRYNASTRTGMQLRSPEVAKFFNIKLDNWNYPPIQPAKVENRKGMLTHPAWLIAHAHNTETDPIQRGKWIREKLLAGTIPDVPITVDAVIPEDHHKTLRQRLEAKTQQEYCWKCHQKMNPLGLPFEMFDDFGRYRTVESLEHPDNLVEKGPDKAPVHVDLRDTYQTLPVNTKGHLAGTGDDKLDGDVDHAFELIDRLAQSERVRQSIIRYAFRYFMGRNEMLSDSKTLIDADKAYLESGGSYDAVIVSLLTSDSFIYRKPIQE